MERILFGRWKEEKEKLSFVCVCVPIRGPPGSLLAYREEKKKKAFDVTSDQLLFSIITRERELPALASCVTWLQL